MIVRGWIEHASDNAAGLIAALRDPRLARAILAIHRDTGREWSVAELAAQSHVSRSVFAERFKSIIGIPPQRYVRKVRMRIAGHWITHEKISIETVALRLGYASQAAFSRAFSASMDIRRALCVSDPRVALIQSMSECYFYHLRGITVGGRTQLENGAETAFHHSRIAISLMAASGAQQSSS